MNTLNKEEVWALYNAGQFDEEERDEHLRMIERFEKLDAEGFSDKGEENYGILHNYFDYLDEVTKEGNVVSEIDKYIDFYCRTNIIAYTRVSTGKFNGNVFSVKCYNFDSIDELEAFIEKNDLIYFEPSVPVVMHYSDGGENPVQLEFTLPTYKLRAYRIGDPVNVANTNSYTKDDDQEYYAGGMEEKL